MNSFEVNIIDKTVEFVKNELSSAEGGHDWWHIYRVWRTSLSIAETENCNKFVVNLAALLHDIADSKFYCGDEEIGPAKAKAFLESCGVNNKLIGDITDIIRNLSFKNTFDSSSYKSMELDIVRDADRLDAIGAIGIARAFNYGGYTGAELYNPNIAPVEFSTKKEYKKANSTTINHFYEKLLKLKNLMNTDTGKK